MPNTNAPLSDFSATVTWQDAAAHTHPPAASRKSATRTRSSADQTVPYAKEGTFTVTVQDQRCGWQQTTANSPSRWSASGSRPTAPATSWDAGGTLFSYSDTTGLINTAGGLPVAERRRRCAGATSLPCWHGVLWKYDQGTFTNTGGGGSRPWSPATAKPSSVRRQLLHTPTASLHLPRWQRVLRHERRPGRSGPDEVSLLFNGTLFKYDQGTWIYPTRRLHRGGRRADGETFVLFNGTLLSGNDVTNSGPIPPMAASPR